MTKEYATQIIGLRAGRIVYDKQIQDVADADLADIYNGDSLIGEGQ